MSSILTNESAMVALQTLQGISKNLSLTQSEIATGKSVSSAKDNAAIWGISQVMQSDVDSMNAISQSLALGESTVAVGRQAAESVADLLNQMKEKAIAAQEDNVDRTKLQAELTSLRDQVAGIVGAAQFNGANLLSNQSTTAGEGTMQVLSAMKRSATGSVTPDNISITKQDLTTNARSIDATGTVTAPGYTTLDATQSKTQAITGIAAGTAFGLSLLGTDADASTITPADYTHDNTTNTLMAASELTYVAREGDTAQDVAQHLVNRYNTYATNNNLDADVLSFQATSTGLTGTSTVTDGTDTIGFQVTSLTSTSNVIGGGLEELANIDISSATGAAAAVTQIEGLTQTAIKSAAQFGTSQNRLEIQREFIDKFSDSMTAGIGALVDADMEQSSARLQALQVQQQLATQALGIANRSPQSLLSLFR